MKSKIVFNKDIPLAIRSLSNFKEGILPIKHLGIPLNFKRLLATHYQPIINKMGKKIGSVHLNTLSQAGRVELIKYVAIPQTFYWFQILKFPVGVTN